MSDSTLWGVNIQGSDDLIAAPDYEEAARIANAFNDWWWRQVCVKPLNSYDPRMWAVPIEWPHSAESHAIALANPSSEYEGFIRTAESDRT